MRVKVTKRGKWYEADRVGLSGSPSVGHGRTCKEAIGDLIYNAGKEMGIELELPGSEYKRIEREYLRAR